MNSLNPPVLGVVGDGQLALMLGEAAEKKGIKLLALGEDAESPFARRYPDRHVLGSPQGKSLSDFFARVQCVTLENEFQSVRTYQDAMNESPTLMVPTLESYAHFEGKVAQRSFFDSLSIPGPRYAVINANATTCPLPLPVVVKADQGGYDGYGVAFADDKEKFNQALSRLGPVVLVEEKVKIEFELAQGAFFDGAGGMTLLPLVETVQKSGICELVLYPARISKSDFPGFQTIENQITEIFKKLTSTPLCGLFNFEFFVTRDVAGQYRVLMNEGAPRPHNSQHLSLDASPESQFDLLIDGMVQKIKGDVGKKLNKVSSHAGAMINILGKTSGVDVPFVMPALPTGITQSVTVHPKLYLKKECRPGRKMGHLNLVDQSATIDLASLIPAIKEGYQL